jgi:hypothetical protein
MTDTRTENLVVELRLLAANPSRREAPAGARQLCTVAADEIDRLRAALNRSADTWHDFDMVLRAIGKPLMAESARIAEADARKVLNAHEDKA